MQFFSHCPDDTSYGVQFAIWNKKSLWHHILCVSKYSPARRKQIPNFELSQKKKTPKSPIYSLFHICTKTYKSLFHKCILINMNISMCFIQDYRQSENTFSSTLATGSNLWVIFFNILKMQDARWWYKCTKSLLTLDQWKALLAVWHTVS